jgi:hypothetical protein
MVVKLTTMVVLSSTLVAAAERDKQVFKIQVQVLVEMVEAV